MFEPESRYFEIETATLVTAAGRTVAYKRRRFLPQAGSQPPASEVVVRQGDRLDLIAARQLGDPELFWQLCDANEAMEPLALTAEPGRKLRVVVDELGEGGG